MKKVFEQLCERFHTTHLAAKCAWCGESIADGLLARLRVEEWQRAAKAGLIELGDDWFAGKIAEMRSGDSHVGMLLYFSCQNFIQGLVQKWTAAHPEVRFEVAAKKVMSAFCTALKSFDGSRVDDFLGYAEGEITRQLS